MQPTLNRNVFCFIDLECGYILLQHCFKYSVAILIQVFRPMNIKPRGQAQTTLSRRAPGCGTLAGSRSRSARGWGMVTALTPMPRNLTMGTRAIVAFWGRGISLVAGMICHAMT